MTFLVGILIFLILIAAFASSKKEQTQRFAPLAIGVVFFVVALSQVFTVIPAGHVGVIDFFGKVSDRTLKPGVNLKNPLARIVKLSTKTQEIKERMEVPSKEGLTIGLEVSILYHLNPEKAAEIYKTVGPNYTDVILVPQFRSGIRTVTSAYEAKALYTSSREQLSNDISKEISRTVEGRGIIIETTPLRNVVLPAGLRKSIEEKLQAEQESQRMEFVLVKERQEAERKKIEAEGIAEFQKVVTKGISEQLLRWKGIEATEKLANSENAKVVIIGNEDGLPLIMNTK